MQVNGYAILLRFRERGERYPRLSTQCVSCKAKFLLPDTGFQRDIKFKTDFDLSMYLTKLHVI